VEKRLSRGLTVLGTYSFSKLMHNNLTSLVKQRHYRSIASLDQPHLFRVAFTYQLPGRFTPHGAGRLLKAAVGGWAVSGLLSLESGLPLSITQSNGRPIVIADPRISGPVNQHLGDAKDAAGNILNPYFNIQAFQALPSQYTVSPQAPYISQLRAPGQALLNTSGTNMSTATFGVITGASNSRAMQAGLKLKF
jgi:hypothetical protein